MKPIDFQWNAALFTRTHRGCTTVPNKLLKIIVT